MTMPPGQDPYAQGQPQYGAPSGQAGQPGYGQPAYGQPAPGQHAYGQPVSQPPYGQPGYPPPGYGGYPPPGYGYGYGAPGQTRTRMSEPLVGWVLLGLSILAIVGSIGPWATFHFLGESATIHGTDKGKDGILSLLTGAVVAVMGLLIGIKQGRLWTSIVALVFAAFTALIGLVDVGDVSSRGDDLSSSVPDSAFSVGWGLWLVLATGVLMLGGSIVAMVRRH